MTYSNLKAELARNGLNYKDLGKAIQKTERSVQNKIAEKSEWTRSEMLLVKGLFKDCSIEYLFFEE